MAHLFSKISARHLLVFLFVGSVGNLTGELTAKANCFSQRPEAVCGDKRICVSGAPNAREGWFDPHSCLPTSPVCRALSQIADEFVGGSKSEEPAAGKAKIEIASAFRIPSRRDCAKYGIPASHCRTNSERGGAAGSHHARCNAADFFVPGYQSRAVQQKLANLMVSQISYAGKNVYCSGRAHVSVSTRENFYRTCVSVSRSGRSNRNHR